MKLWPLLLVALGALPACWSPPGDRIMTMWDLLSVDGVAVPRSAHDRIRYYEHGAFNHRVGDVTRYGRYEESWGEVRLYYDDGTIGDWLVFESDCTDRPFVCDSYHPYDSPDIHGHMPLDVGVELRAPGF